MLSFDGVALNQFLHTLVVIDVAVLILWDKVYSQI